MNYRELDVPCFKCNERYVGCHGKCEKYADFVERNKKRREEMFRAKDTAEALTENVRKCARRSKKYLKNIYY